MMIKINSTRMVTTTSPSMTCHLSQKSTTRCGPHSSNSQVQTLDELDAASMRVPGKQMKISWMILSRVGVEFLNAPSCGRWTICQNHRKEFLDVWQVGKFCCHPGHLHENDNLSPNHLVSMVMSVKILQSEGKVLPISGKLCQACKDLYDARYSSKAGEKIVIIMPRAQLPMASPLTVPSPFCRLSPPQRNTRNVVELYREPPSTTDTDIKPHHLQDLNVNQNNKQPTILEPIVRISSMGLQVQGYAQPLSAEAQVQTSSKSISNQNTGKNIHRSQSLSHRGQSAPDKSACAINQDADIIELDITPPTSPISLANNLTSRMEEVLAEKAVETSSTSMPGPNPDMIRSLNLVPTTEHRKESSSSFQFEGLNRTEHQNLNKVPNTIPNESSEDGMPKDMRSDTPESDSSLDSITIKVETMEHPVLATDAEMDEAKEGETQNTSKDKNYLEIESDHDESETEDIDDVEERALSAMSILSRGSDDDPTWAPSETEKIKLVQKKAKSDKLMKGLSENSRRREQNIFAKKGAKKISTAKVKKGRGRPPSGKAIINQKSLGKHSNQKNMIVNYPKGKKTRLDGSMPKQLTKFLTPTAEQRNNNGNIISNDTNEDLYDHSSSDEEFIDLSEKANRIEGAGGNDFHYYCKICQISFFRHNAFKHHMNNSKQQHKKIKSQQKAKKDFEMVYQCKECCIAFKDRKSYQRHMSDEHQGSTEHQYHCQKCDVYLKSESAFKSHNSKLHLERREKTYYCRECDETFSCLVKHSLHIVVHRTWVEENMGMQCRICGKVFTRNQTLPFHRHLATHDSEPETKCACHNCLEFEMEDEEDNDDPEVSFNTKLATEVNPLEHVDVVSTSSGTRRGRKRGYKETLDEEASVNSSRDSAVSGSTGLFEALKKNFLSSNKDVQGKNEEEDDALRPFECGICNQTFSTVETLQDHVVEMHNESMSDKQENENNRKEKRNREISNEVIDEVTDEFADEVAAFEAAEEKMQKQLDAKRAKFEEKKNSNKVMMVTMVKKTGKIVVGGKRPSERNWQECPARNWAAEFGYGGMAPETTFNKSYNEASNTHSKQGHLRLSLGSKENEEDATKKETGSAPLEGGDLFSKMRATFKKDGNEAEDNEELIKGDGDKMFRSRGLKGTVKASPGKAPRTLSSSSLRTRHRMEALMKRAREFMKQNKKEQVKTNGQDTLKQKISESTKKNVKVDSRIKHVNKSKKNSPSVEDKSSEPTEPIKKSKVESQKEHILEQAPSKRKPSGRDVEVCPIADDTTNKNAINLKSTDDLTKIPRINSSVEVTRRISADITRNTRSQRIKPCSNIQIQEESSLVDVVKKSTKDLNTNKNYLEPGIIVSTEDKNKNKEDNNSVVATGRKTRMPVQLSLLERMQKNFENVVKDADQAVDGNDISIDSEDKNKDNDVQKTPLDIIQQNQKAGRGIGDFDSNERDKNEKTSDTDAIQQQKGNNPKACQASSSKMNENVGVENDAESDDDDSDIDMDGLLIPLENGWVCEKRLLGEEERKQRLQELELLRRRRGRSAADDEFAAMRHATHFWSPDGQRHSSLAAIKAYGIKHRLRLNMAIFENGVKNNPPEGECISGITENEDEEEEDEEDCEDITNVNMGVETE